MTAVVRDGEQRVDPSPAAVDDGVPAVGLTGTDARLAPGFVHVDAHPEHGEPVVYTPGELLPDWLRDALASGATLKVESPGHFRLVLPSRAARKQGGR